MSKPALVKAAEPARPNPMLAALAGTAQPPASAHELQTGPMPPSAAIPAESIAPLAQKADEQKLAKRKKSARPSRQNRRFMGGFFPPHVHKAMGYVMVEEDRTLQDLIEEAVHDFLVRKGQGKRLTPR